jgi:hypothetical protein
MKQMNSEKLNTRQILLFQFKIFEFLKKFFAFFPHFFSKKNFQRKKQKQKSKKLF